MQAVRHMLHSIWEFGLIRPQIPGVVASVRPTIIQNDVLVPEIPQPRVDKDLGSVKEERLRDIAEERVPIILGRTNISDAYLPSVRQVSIYPSHWRGSCQSIINCFHGGTQEASGQKDSGDQPHFGTREIGPISRAARGKKK